jgi:hypothetical protein
VFAQDEHELIKNELQNKNVVYINRTLIKILRQTPSNIDSTFNLIIKKTLLINNIVECWIQSK